MWRLLIAAIASIGFAGAALADPAKSPAYPETRKVDVVEQQPTAAPGEQREEQQHHRPDDDERRDFEQHLASVPGGSPRLLAFLGSTIGNLYPEQRARFLRRGNRRQFVQVRARIQAMATIGRAASHTKASRTAQGSAVSQEPAEG